MAMLFDVRRGSCVDGPGIRTVVFVKGCNLRCKWCHNPESQESAQQRMWYEHKCNDCGACIAACQNGCLAADEKTGKPVFNAENCGICGRCTEVCPSGAAVICGFSSDTEALAETIKKDRIFYEATGGGVTISGGECMLQPDFTAALLKKCKYEKISTAVDTAGNVPWESFEKVMPHTDMFLYDIKCITSSLHRNFTGCGNALILENYKKLLSHGCRVIVRVPLICGFNDSHAEFAKITDFLQSFTPESAEILPYHRLGETKYAALGTDIPRSFDIPDENILDEYRKILRRIISTAQPHRSRFP